MTAAVYREIPLADLADVWQGLTRVMDNYDAASWTWACLVEARRLVEVEINLQHEQAGRALLEMLHA